MIRLSELLSSHRRRIFLFRQAQRIVPRGRRLVRNATFLLSCLSQFRRRRQLIEPLLARTPSLGKRLSQLRNGYLIDVDSMVAWLALLISVISNLSFLVANLALIDDSGCQRLGGALQLELWL